MKYVYLFNEGSRAAIYGIGTYIRQMIECLKSVPEISLNIVLLYSDVNEFCIEYCDNYRVYNIPSKNISTRNNVSRYYRNAFFLISNEIHLNQNDRLIFHLNYHQEYPLIKLMKQKWEKCSVYYTIHYQNWSFQLKGNTSYLKKILSIGPQNEKEKYLLTSFNNEKKLYQSVDKIMCLSVYTRELLQDIYQIVNDKIYLMYNGLDIDLVLKGESDFSIKEKFFIPEDEKIILFVGRLDEIKGVDILIDAFKKVVRVFPSSHLVIIGDGDYTKCLYNSKNYWGKITYTGRLEKEDLSKFYQIADVGVMPSMHEQCSYVAIEMMMYGIPLITSTSTGLREMQVNEQLLIEVIESGDQVYISSEQLAGLILEVLNSDKSIYAEKYESWISKYGSNIMLQHICECYD